MDGYFLTHRGKVRNLNEDAGGIYYNESGQPLAMIADGMGGHRAGDVASNMATGLIQDKWEKHSGINQPGEAEQWLSYVIAEVNKTIFDEANSRKECEGMGTTAVIAICTEEFITIAHIGDSRCYLLNESGFEQVTEDHSLVNELVRAGQISKDDAEHHPRKNVLLKALGTEKSVTEDIQTITWDVGNKILLCSDGLTDKLADDELNELISSDRDVKVIAEEMVEIANERGGEDNISLVILQHTSTLGGGET